MALNERLERATKCIRSGKTEEARQLLEQIIKEDRHNIAAWQWYAVTWPDPRDKIRVWEVCLRHSPSNAEAEQALALLKPNLTSRDREATRHGARVVVAGRHRRADAGRRHCNRCSSRRA